MLLDTNSPAADTAPAPLPDRPARTDAAPQRRDDSQSSDDRSNDLDPPSTPDSSNTQSVQSGNDGDAVVKNADTAKSSDGKVNAKDDTKNGSKNATDAANTNDSNTGQNSGDAADSGTQLVFVLTVIGLANAPMPISIDNTLTPPANPTTIAPAVSPATTFAPVVPVSTPSNDQAPQDGQPATKQSTHDSQSSDTSAPIDLSKDAASTVLANEIPQAPKTAPAGTIKAGEPIDETDRNASAEPADGTTPAAQNAPVNSAKPDQKIVPPGRVDLAAPAEKTAPVNTPAPTTPATLVPLPPPAKKAALPAAPAPASVGDVQAAANMQSAPAPIKIDAAGRNENPANGIHEQSANADGSKTDVAKTDGTKADAAKAGGEYESDPIHHPAFEHEPGGEMSALPASRVGTQSNTATGATDSMSLSGASTLTAQLTAAPMPAAAAALPAVAPAAIPLAALPIEIASQAKDGKNRFEIRLDPPELGRIDVRLDIDNKGIVTSRLTADRPETLDLLRRDAPQIERALQDAGLKTSNQGLQFSLRDQSFAGRNDSTLPPPAQLVLPDDETVPLETVRQGYGRLFGLGGGIDIRV